MYNFEELHSAKVSNLLERIVELERWKWEDIYQRWFRGCLSVSNIPFQYSVVYYKSSFEIKLILLFRFILIILPMQYLTKLNLKLNFKPSTLMKTSKTEVLQLPSANHVNLNLIFTAFRREKQLAKEQCSNFFFSMNLLALSANNCNKR